MRRRGRWSAPARESARTGSTRVRAADGADVVHLETFIETRTGVEGFVEPRTAVSEVTLLLVAHDGAEVAEHVRSLTPERARKIGEAALENVRAVHTYDHRAALVESVLDGAYRAARPAAEAQLVG